MVDSAAVSNPASLVAFGSTPWVLFKIFPPSDDFQVHVYPWWSVVVELQFIFSNLVIHKAVPTKCG